MMKKLLTGATGSVTAAAALVGFFSLLSRVVGLLRDRVLVHTVGVGDTLDAYYAAFRIPDMLFQLLILGTLSATFIPAFLAYWEKREEDAWRYTNALLTLIVGGFGFLAGVCALAAPYLVPLVGYGFSADQQAMTVAMFRVILLAQTCFSVSMIFGSVLQATRRFLLYSCAPIVYNAGIMLGAWLLVPKMGPIGLAWGTVFGALFHAGLQFWGARSLGYRFSCIWSYDKSVRTTIARMGPRTISLAVAQVVFIFMTTLASTLEKGSVTMLQFAYNLNYFPIGVIAVSYAIAAFPAFCDATRGGEGKRSFREVFRSTVGQVCFLMIPATVAFLLLRAQIVRLVLGTGSFSWESTVLTADALAIFAISFCAQGLVYVLVRGFFALEQTKIPVVIALISGGCTAILAYYGAHYAGLLGIVGAFSFGSLVQCAALWAMLRVIAGNLGGRALAQSLAKQTLAAVGMAISMQAMKVILGNAFPLTTFFAVFFQLLGASMVGGVVYVGIALVVKTEECSVFLAQVRARFLKKATVKELPPTT